MDLNPISQAKDKPSLIAQSSVMGTDTPINFLDVPAIQTPWLSLSTAAAPVKLELGKTLLSVFILMV